MELINKVALITRAGRGICCPIALAPGKAGASVFTVLSVWPA
jgi:hypothetical protein